MSSTSNVSEARAVGAGTSKPASSRRLTQTTEWRYHERVITKNEQGLGLDVEPDEDGIIVTAVVPDGAAAKAGGWHVDDRIILINDQKVVGKTSAEMLAALRETKGDVKLGVLSREFTNNGTYRGQAPVVATEYVYEDVVVTRGKDGLGLDIAVNDDGILITNIVPGGAAEATGALRTNDNIVSINGQPILGKTQSEVVDMLRNAGDSVKLTVIARNTLHPRHRDAGSMCVIS